MTLMAPWTIEPFKGYLRPDMTWEENTPQEIKDAYEAYWDETDSAVDADGIKLKV